MTVPATDPSAAAPLDVRRRRTLFRARHRGMRELDIVIGGYAEAHIADLDEAELDLLEALLEVRDDEVFGWLVGRTPVAAAHDTPLWRAMTAFHAASLAAGR